MNSTAKNNLACWSKKDKILHPTIIYVNTDSLKEIKEYLFEYKKRYNPRQPCVLFFNDKSGKQNLVVESFRYLKEISVNIIGVAGDLNPFKESLSEQSVFVVALFDKNKNNETTEKDLEKPALTIDQNINSSVQVVVEQSKEQEQPKEQEQAPIISDKEKVFVEKEYIIKEVRDVHYKGNVRGGQELCSENGSVFVYGNLNENAIIRSEGSVVVRGYANGRIFVESKNKDSCIMIDKFNAYLVSINGVAKIFENGIPDNIKNKPVNIFLNDGSLEFEVLA